MTVLQFVAGDSIFRIEDHTDATLTETKTPHPFLCLAADPFNRNRMYAGTFDNGLWVSDDGGVTWKKSGDGMSSNRIPSVAVSPTESVNGYGVVWAGTEPSMLFRSEDGGATWTNFPRLGELPSHDTWSFPPRPHTHHVRYIQPDLHMENRIFVGIELGGVMKSEDKGHHWEDRKQHSQFDCHTMTMHPEVTGRIYEAAGGGYAESRDGGATWETINAGLEPYTYLVNIAVDRGDPDTIIAAAAKGAHSAYRPSSAHTVIVKSEAGNPWEIVNDGLPSPDGSSVFSLVSHPEDAGVFYAVNNIGCYKSYDSGKTWRKLTLQWPESVKDKRIHAMTVQT